MSLTTVTEELGAAVGAGLLDREEAAQRLFEYADGGLTRLGAADQIERWQTVRARYADEMMRAELGLAAVQASLRKRGESS